MAAEYEDVKYIRDHFSIVAETNLPIFKEMFDRMTTLHDTANKEVMKMVAGNHSASDVGVDLSTMKSPIGMLQRLRRSVYPLAKIVDYFRLDLFPNARTTHDDCKSLYINIWTEMIGSEEVLARLKSNVDKEREVEYILRAIKYRYSQIVTLYAKTRSLVDWLSDNLDALNKLESSLRLEHNMRNTIGAIGDNVGADVGVEGEGELGAPAALSMGHDPVFDDEEL